MNDEQDKIIPWWRKHPTLIGEMQFCENCKYFDRASEDSGICRRFPPTVNQNDSSGEEDGYPMPGCSGWCGEWSSREKFVWPKNSLGEIIKQMAELGPSKETP